MDIQQTFTVRSEVQPLRRDMLLSQTVTEYAPTRTESAKSTPAEKETTSAYKVNLSSQAQEKSKAEFNQKQSQAKSEFNRKQDAEKAAFLRKQQNEKAQFLRRQQTNAQPSESLFLVAAHPSLSPKKY